jgi:hypothetical protein
LDFIQNMRKASSAEPIPNAAPCNALTEDGVVCKILLGQPGVVLIHETLGAYSISENFQTLARHPKSLLPNRKCFYGIFRAPIATFV